MLIKSSYYIDNIEKIVKNKKKDNFDIINLSDWSSSYNYQNNFVIHFPNETIDPFPYFYTYNIPLNIRRNILSKIDIKNKDCIICNCSTSAIVLVACYIKKIIKGKVLLISPNYFSVNEVFNDFNIDYDIRFIKPKHNLSEILKNIDDYSAIWITNPIYNRGVQYSTSDIKLLEKISNFGTYIISDESLAITNDFIETKLNNNTNFISIISPFKCIQLNNFKFSLITIDSKDKDFFDQWYEVYHGQLSNSSYNSIMFFFNENIKKYETIFLDYTKNSKARLSKLLMKFHNFYTDKNTFGNYVTIYTNIKFQSKKIFHFIKESIESDGVYFIPNNIYDNSNLLSFRINLTLYNDKYENKLLRLLVKLSNLHL